MGRSRVALVAALLWLWLDLLRVWTPSLITVFGRAAETPPELIGAFALGVCAVPWLLTVVLPHATRRLVLAAVVLAVSRVAVQVADGGRPQLVAASIGVVAGLWALSLVIGRYAGALAPGLAWGTLLGVGSQATLAGYGAVWRRDVWGWLEVVVALIVLWRAWARRELAEDPWPPSRRAALLVFPALLLAGILTANLGRASAVDGRAGIAWVVAATAVGVLAAYSAPAGRLARLLVAAALVLAVVAAIVPASTYLPAAAGLPLLVCLLAATVGRSAVPGRGGARWVAAGAIAWVVLFFVYYAGYDLGYRADPVLVLLAAGIGVTAVLPGTLRAPGSGDTPRAAAVTCGLVGVALALVAPALTLRPDPVTPHDGGLRVMAWNLRMGYGIDGRFDARGVAELIGREHPDVVLLSEIDRGWLLNGGQDQLAILQRLTGYHAAFGAAADPVWGDAILSATPLSDVRRHRLPAHGAVTGAQALSARVEADGREVTVVSTHLQPGADGTDDTVAQAGDLADVVADLPGPVIVGGDLNTTPDSAGWDALTAAGLEDALADARPLLTSSADDPRRRSTTCWSAPGSTPRRRGRPGPCSPITCRWSSTSSSAPGARRRDEPRRAVSGGVGRRRAAGSESDGERVVGG